MIENITREGDGRMVTQNFAETVRTPDGYILTVTADSPHTLMNLLKELRNSVSAAILRVEPHVGG
jgi:hypothetical protein